MKEPIKLTKYSHGAGCGCKISPLVLSSILKTNTPKIKDAKLLVGNDTSDDAAVYDLGDGTAIISTTDFFLPIADDPFTFGQIAATNAISDIYAMGGKPLLAIAILGWPINKLSADIAAQVMEGGRKACTTAGITLAGGHSIDNPEPIFGLAVTGLVDIKNLKKNDNAEVGCKLYLTKPLGIGILATAQKQGILQDADKNIAPDSMIIMNDVGAELSKMESVTAITDVTGFGLLGHLIEMCEGSDVSAQINFNEVPVFPQAIKYLKKGAIPGGTMRNWNSFSCKLEKLPQEKINILCDPQTSGGLLIAVKKEACKNVEAILNSRNLHAKHIGEIINKTDKIVVIK